MTAVHPTRRRILTALAVAIAVLAGVNLVQRFGPAHAGLVIGPTVAVALVLLARRAGLSWDDLGLARRSWGKGAAYGGVAVVLVAGCYALAAALPVTRAVFLDARYHLQPGRALLTALLVIPLSTVLLEEVAFRGVLHGLVRRHRGTAWATAVSSALFGLWHVLPSLHLDHANQAVRGAEHHVGAAGPAHLLVIAAVVGFTALCGLVLGELRRRSGSVLAAAGLHWATNGLGVLVATTLWTLRVM